ncbi:MAG: hypothetical protein FJX76_28695 [Armatimonadetes bacterium]|nr:hypothetical protein [Armatimonadota bacterium]
MRRDQRHNRPWQRKSTSAPAAVYREMHHRRLDDLTACRTAWEQASDPLALCVAVDNADLPEWLVDALLPLLMDDSGGLLKSLWRQRRRDMIDAWRAVQVTRARGESERA